MSYLFGHCGSENHFELCTVDNWLAGGCDAKADTHRIFIPTKSIECQDIGTGMGYSKEKKLEIIQQVESSDKPIAKLLQELGINRSTFYNWYTEFKKHGSDGLDNKKTSPKRFWNRIPQKEKSAIVDLALGQPSMTPREIALYLTDKHKTYLSKSSVYRILKAYDQLRDKRFLVLTPAEASRITTTSKHQLWHTYFCYFKTLGWEWYYLSMVIDDYSRYIIKWQLFMELSRDDVEKLLIPAVDEMRIDSIGLYHRPRLLFDQGPYYLTERLVHFLLQERSGTLADKMLPDTSSLKRITASRRDMRNLIVIDKYMLPDDLRRMIGRFVETYNHHSYHEALGNVTPADVYYGRHEKIISDRDVIKEQTLMERRLHNLGENRFTS